MKKFLYIARYIALAVLLLLLLALAPAMAQNVVYQFKTTQLGIEEHPGDTYTWELYRDSTVNFAEVSGDCPATDAAFVGGNTSATVNVEWKEPGIYFFKVTARNSAGCTNNLKIGRMKVLHALPTATIVADSAVCQREKIELKVTLTGTPPWNFTYTDGTNSWTIDNVTETDLRAKDLPIYIYVIKIDPGPNVTTDYWITRVTDKYGINEVPSVKATQQINPLPEKSTIYHR